MNVESRAPPARQRARPSVQTSTPTSRTPPASCRDRSVSSRRSRDVTLSAEDVNGQKVLHAPVFVEVVLGPSKAVTLTFVLDVFDCPAGRSTALDERPALLDGNHLIAVTVHDEQWHPRQSVGEMQRRTIGVENSGVGKRADECVGVVTLEAMAALGQVG